MQSPKVEINEVIYNAAEQAFEGKVVIHDDAGSHSYACSIDAPISMPFKRASQGLVKQAMRRHGTQNGLRSYLERMPKLVPLQLVYAQKRRGLPVGQYGFFRGRAA